MSIPAFRYVSWFWTRILLKRIAAELEDADGDFVAGIYNQVFADPIQYVGDSMFEPLELSTLQHQV